MKSCFNYFFALTLLVGLAATSNAQGIIDGVRLTSNPIGDGARSMAMGDAMIAAANDFTALDFNPAALTAVEHGEFSVSLYNKGYSSNAQFFGNAATNTITNTIPFSFGYASEVPTTRGHLAFGISFDRVADFTSTYKFSGVNPKSSLLNTQHFVDDRGFHGGNFNDYLNSLYSTNLAWALFLTFAPDSLNPALTTPFHGGLLQAGTVTQEGGLNAFRVGGGIEIAENISVGATLNVIFGTYDYRRTYSETDVNNLFSQNPDTTKPANFRSATIVDTRSQSINGVSMKFGIYSEPNDFLKVGLTFATPTYFSIDDHFSRYGIATFASGDIIDSRDPSTVDPGVNPFTSLSYSITSPLTFGGGLAFNHWGLTVAASAELADYSQIRFSNSDVDLSDLNDFARANLRSVLSWNLGGEYMIKPIGLLVRGGYSDRPSPYKADPSTYDTKTWSVGIGLLLSKSAILEVSYRNTKYRTDHLLYGGNTAGPNPAFVSSNINQDDVKTDEVAVSFSFRF